MCNLYSITTNQAAIAALFRVVNRYVGNLAPMPGVFPDYPAPVVRNAGSDRKFVLMRWACLRRREPAGRRSPTSGTSLASCVQPERSPKRALEARYTWE
jgi:putative SOS response-associated peptidase YedK